MTGAQRSYLKTLCKEAKVPFDDEEITRNKTARTAARVLPLMGGERSPYESGRLRRNRSFSSDARWLCGGTGRAGAGGVRRAAACRRDRQASAALSLSPLPRPVSVLAVRRGPFSGGRARGLATGP